MKGLELNDQSIGQSNDLHLRFISSKLWGAAALQRPDTTMCCECKTQKWPFAVS